MIYIDDRVGSKELVDLVENGVLTQLEFGDAMFMGLGPDGEVSIGCERKVIGDLINSVASGRLSGHQLPGMLNTYFRVYLIIEGLWKQNAVTGVLETFKHGKWIAANHGKRVFNYRDLWQYLCTLENMTGVVVRQTANILETATQIEALRKWWNKPWENHRAHQGIHKAQPTTAYIGLEKPSLLRRICLELPGIGWERGKVVDKHFHGSVRETYEATEEEWREIEGIGKLTAKKVWEVLHK